MNDTCLCTAWGLVAVALLGLTRTPEAAAQGIDLANRPIAEIRIEGLKEIPEQLVRNQIRLKKGDPYDARIVDQDIVRIIHLGRFNTVTAKAQPLADGSLMLSYVLTEQAPIADVLFVGNKQISDQELAKMVLLRAGDREAPFLIDRAIRQIKQAYERKGYFVTDVTVDQKRLDEEGILLFQVREGPRPRIRAIRFHGNRTFTDKQLQSKIRSKAYIPLLRKGQLSRVQLGLDVAELRRFYHGRGYLDADVGREIEESPDWRDAVVRFRIKEGRRYTVATIVVEGNRLFPTPQILARMDLKVGDIYSAERVRRSQEGLFDMYGKLGYLQTKVEIGDVFHEKLPQVHARVKINEGIAHVVGKITVQGNQLTKQEVVLRQVRGMRPGQRFDRTGLKITRSRLAPSALFDQARVTILGRPEDEVRDVLIEVKEKNTGSISFGAGISSDAGVAGAIGLVQRNFDIADVPESFGEFISGKAFRGAGQYFALRLAPGGERSAYSLTFREPYILDSDYFLDTNLFFFQRQREDWDERRLGGHLGVGQRFGDVYSAAVRLRVERVEIEDIDNAAPRDVFAVEGDNEVTSAGFNVARDTTDNRIFPTHGSRLRARIERTGALGGDFDFTKANVSARKFWAVAEDFFGRSTVLSLRGEIGYIFESEEAPLFERFYTGGHRSFRGYRFRGVGPRGINMAGKETNDPVGGEFLFLLGAEYNFPIYEDILRAVFFIDSGTVRDSFGLGDYRLSVGTGMRVRIPFMASPPFAFDISLPVSKEDGDETRVFSFDIAIPF